MVLVGTSTGGPPALEALLVPLPADFPWPILVAQHMPASFHRAACKRLDGICALKVVEVVEPDDPGKRAASTSAAGDADIIVSRRSARPGRDARAVAKPAIRGIPAPIDWCAPPWTTCLRASSSAS